MIEIIFDENGRREIELTAAQIAIDNESQAISVRSIRNALLSACDWTQVADSTADKQAWATYRQALRDVPSQAGFPRDVQWPTQPE